jgi:hypothetical protein
VVIWQAIRDVIFHLTVLRYWLVSWISYPDWAPQWKSRRQRSAVSAAYSKLVYSNLAAADIMEKLKQEQPTVKLATWNKRDVGLLHMAVRAKRVDLITMMVKEGCDLEARWGVLSSPFLYACVTGSTPVVEALLSSRPAYPDGPQMNMPCAPSPLEVAWSNNNRDLYIYLLRKGAQASPRQLRHAILQDDRETVQVRSSPGQDAFLIRISPCGGLTLALTLAYMEQ